MRQINFLILFAILLAISLFAMQNANPVAVTFAPGVSVQLPLVLELLAAAGVGATFAWMYGLWMKMQFMVEVRDKNREIQEKEGQINELKQIVVDLETTVKALPPSKRAEPPQEEEITVSEGSTIAS
ncbi:MAG: LapA family protein [Cyanobacteriota bacterium]|nr:LapA family protein [Cyanobacteriota bacterium]